MLSLRKTHKNTLILALKLTPFTLAMYDSLHMKKYTLFLGALLLLIASTPAYAQGRGDMDRVQDPETHAEINEDGSTYAQAKSEYVGNGEQAQVYNQVRVSNQGEEQQIETTTMESYGTGSAMMAEPKQQAIQSMNEVAQRAQQLIEERGESRGIGQALSQFAQDQQTSMGKVEQAFDQIGQRTGLSRWLWGSDQQALTSLRDESAIIDTRIQHLEDAKATLNTADQAIIDELIAQLETQKSALEEEITQENEAFSVVGFFRNLFGRNR